MLERFGVKIYYHYATVGGSDAAIHGHDHYEMQEFEKKLKTHQVLPTNEAKAKAIHLLQGLVYSAEATKGNVAEHVAYRERINTWFPTRLKILVGDLRVSADLQPSRLSSDKKYKPRRRGGGNPYR